MIMTGPSGILARALEIVIGIVVIDRVQGVMIDTVGRVLSIETCVVRVKGRRKCVVKMLFFVSTCRNTISVCFCNLLSC